MDYRSDSFISKFSDALRYLGANSIQDLISIKYRDDTRDEEYHAFIEGYLEGEMNLETTEVHGRFQGRAWLVADKDQNKALLVEHETGLEVLYIAGSIASLLSLIPLINSGWKFMRNRFQDRRFFSDRAAGIEIRIIDQKNQLVEQHVLRVEDFIISESMKEIATLKARVERLERELIKIRESKPKRSPSKKPASASQASKK
jgi:hypothetical protein